MDFMKIFSLIDTTIDELPDNEYIFIECLTSETLELIENFVSEKIISLKFISELKSCVLSQTHSIRT